MLFEVACRLLVIDEVVDGGIGAADGTCVAMPYVDRAELHGLGIERQQTIGQEFAYASEILQCLGSLNGAQHTSDSPQHTSLRACGYGSCRRRFLEHAAIAGSARQMGERLAIET